MKRLFLIILLATASIWAENNNPEETFEMKNGRFWNRLVSSDSRVTFLLGLIDGWKLREFTKDAILAKELIAWQGNPKATIGDLTEMITSVYGETENQTLPVGWVAMGCLAVQRGDATRDAVFIVLRKHLTTELGRTDPSPATEIDPIDVILQFRKH
jgi:hypothetical protein